MSYSGKSLNWHCNGEMNLAKSIGFLINDRSMPLFHLPVLTKVVIIHKKAHYPITVQTIALRPILIMAVRFIIDKGLNEIDKAHAIFKHGNFS